MTPTLRFTKITFQTMFSGFCPTRGKLPGLCVTVAESPAIASSRHRAVVER
jgi:hypothetical protein